MSFKMSISEPKPRKRFRRRKRKKESEYAGIEGLERITLDPLTQKIIGCIAGETVTGEDPWTYIKKEALTDDIELREDETELFPLREKVFAFPKENVLVGYIPDEARNFDEFYLCLTENAEDEVTLINERLKNERRERMARVCSKSVGFWKPLNSAAEIDLNKRNRNLYEVELTTKYPMMQVIPHMKFRLVENCRDGYIEVLTTRQQIDYITMARIDKEVQSAPILTQMFCQTDLPSCTRNNWTQYFYEYEVTKLPPESNAVLTKKWPELNEQLTISGSMNLYKNDYAQLVQHIKFTQPYAPLLLKDRMSFFDIDLCKNMFVTDVSWDPFMTGIIAACYQPTSNHFFSKSWVGKPDVVAPLKYAPVLVWSCVESLKPRLMLQTMREISCIAFCPYDDNLIVGGCSNGQVILWDIKDKIHQAETAEFLLPHQQAYRLRMNMMMEWFLNVKDPSIVPYTAISDLFYSHNRAVTQIKWVPPYFEFTKTGLCNKISGPFTAGNFSYQFMTISLDGNVCIWDLRRKPSSGFGGYKHGRRMRRLKRRPSGLNVDVSPLKILNRTLRPIYKLSLDATDPRKIPILCFALPHCPMRYKREDVHYGQEKFKFQDRLQLAPVFEVPYDHYPLNIKVGTASGVVMNCTWTGFDYSSNDPVMEEICQITANDSYHDGPISQIEYWPKFPQVFITIGGKVFCIWHKDMQNKPVMWRKCKYRYTALQFQPKNFATFSLTRSDGVLETWNLKLKSFLPMNADAISGGTLTGYYTNPGFYKIACVGDCTGYLRLFHPHKKVVPADVRSTCFTSLKIIEKQMHIILDFEKWQKKWILKHESLINLAKEAHERAYRAELKRKYSENVALQKLEKKKMIEEQKAERLKNTAPPGQYKEWQEEKLIEREKKRMHRVLLQIKHLNPDTLHEEQKPITDQIYENKLRVERQRRRHANSQKIFYEAVAMYFPHFLVKDPPPAKDPWAGGDSEEEMKSAIENYIYATKDMQHYIKMHQFKYYLDWNKVINTETEKKMVILRGHKGGHERRHEKRKNKEETPEHSESFHESITESLTESNMEGGGDFVASYYP